MSYRNIAQASTNKSKLQALYCHQKHATRIIHFKEKFTSAISLFEQINVMAVFEMNIFQTLWFMYLCKNGNTASIIKQIKKNTQQDLKMYCIYKQLCKKNFAKFKLMYHGLHLWNKVITPNNELLLQAVTINTFKKDYLSIY